MSNLPIPSGAASSLDCVPVHDAEDEPSEFPLGPGGRGLIALGTLPLAMLAALLLADAVPWVARGLLGVAVLALMGASLAQICPALDRDAPRRLRIEPCGMGAPGILVQCAQRWQPVELGRVVDAGGFGIWLRLQTQGRARYVFLDAGRLTPGAWRAARRSLLAQ